MPKNLVIVESPAKARTIERYLGADYRVLASYGHVRDLPENPGKGKLGVDVEHDFEPNYEVSDDRRKQVAEIAKAAKRRGPGLPRHRPRPRGRGDRLARRGGGQRPRDKTRRVTFSEITERAIREAFAHPRDIDMHLVDAQQARRIVDRLVGYTLSPLLSRKVRGGLSAGRVQSVAVRLVVEREREIDAFTAREYWTLEALLATRPARRSPPSWSGSTAEALDVGDETTAERHADAIRGRSTRSSRRSARASRSAQPGAAVHDVDAPAGGEPQARLQPEADDVGRAAAVRGRRDAGRPRRADHLHADGLDGDRRRGDGRGAGGHPGALRRAVHDAEGPASTRRSRRAPRRPTSRSGRLVPARPGLAGAAR